MWKKTENPPPSSDYVPPTRTAPQADGGQRAMIGASILLKGDISGEEDLLIQGRVEGQINLDGNNLTIGSRGRVKADIRAKVISVEGEVRGNLHGEEKITIRKTGNVKGNLVAPRVSLEDGATFKGSIDMGSKTAQPDIPAKDEKASESASSKPGSESTSAIKSPPKTAEMPLHRSR